MLWSDFTSNNHIHISRLMFLVWKCSDKSTSLYLTSTKQDMVNRADCGRMILCFWLHHQALQQHPRSGCLLDSAVMCLVYFWRKHRANRARQEVRQWNGTVYPVNFGMYSTAKSEVLTLNTLTTHTTDEMSHEFYSNLSKSTTSCRHDAPPLNHSQWDTKSHGGQNKRDVHMPGNKMSPVERGYTRCSVDPWLGSGKHGLV